MRNFFFILLFFSSHLIFSDEILEIYLDEQHYKLFDYINKKSDLIEKDYDAFIKGFELSIKGIIDPKEISKRVMGKKFIMKLQSFKKKDSI